MSAAETPPPALPPRVIRILGLEDIAAYKVFEAAMRDLSGRVEHHHGPFPMGELVPTDFESSVRARMLASVGSDGWQRYWGAFDGSNVVGVSSVGHSGVASESHRCTLGMGVLPSNRRIGVGRELLRTTATWCRSEPTLGWLDLGVFGHNAGAIALYESESFVEIGRMTDRFRVDGIRIEDISMTLLVE